MESYTDVVGKKDGRSHKAVSPVDSSVETCSFVSLLPPTSVPPRAELASKSFGFGSLYEHAEVWSGGQGQSKRVKSQCYFLLV